MMGFYRSLRLHFSRIIPGCAQQLFLRPCHMDEQTSLQQSTAAPQIIPESSRFNSTSAERLTINPERGYTLILYVSGVPDNSFLEDRGVPTACRFVRSM